MNRHTFGDATKGTKSSIDIELAMNNDVSDDDEGDVIASKERIEGEEDTDPVEKFNDVGEVMEPFNMKNERDGGTIDESGSYHFAKEQGARDAWLNDMDEATLEKEIGDAQEGLRRRQQLEKEREAAEADTIQKSPLQLKLELIDLMEPMETVAGALRRYGNMSKLNQNQKHSNSNSNSNNKGESMQGEGNKPTSREIRHRIEELTELASQLLSVDKTLTGIYDMTRESIEASTVMWEYKGHDNVIQGPFTSLQISEWKRAGYLTGSTAVMMRKINPEVMEKRKLDAERWEERNENEKKRARIEIAEPQKKSMAQELADDLNDDDEDSDDGLTIAEIMAKDRAKKTKATQQQQQQQQQRMKPTLVKLCRFLPRNLS